MLEHQEGPDISRRWRVALALIAAAVIPLQLVARTPTEAPPQEWAPDSGVIVFTAPRTGEVLKLAQIDLPKEREMRAELEKAAEQIKAAEAALKVQEKQAQELTSQQKMLEAMAQIEAARARMVEARQAQQTEDQKRLLAVMALIKSAAAHRDAEMLRNTLTMAELLKLQDKLNVQPGDLAQQYRRLAEHYEQLAVEQRKLAEEIERLRSEQLRPER